MDNISNIMAAIVAILKNNGLTELSLENYDELNDPAYIIWFDDDGTPYDDPVIKVIVENSEISVELEARNFSNNVTLQDYEIDRLEWWQGIHACVLEVLENDGKRRCPACGKPLRARQKYCSETCRKFAMPQPTPQKVAELANKRIQKLIARIAQGNRKLRAELIEKYTVKL
jgi:predicted nucleic acid-binding Zn ribbon protein